MPISAGLIHGLVQRADGCIPCPDVVPQCNCAANEICQQTATTCTTCATVQCIPSSSSNSGGSSGPPGALIGAIVAVVVVVALVASGVFWYRRRALKRAKRDEPVQIKDVPAPAAAVLSRPDPSEKAVSLYSNQGAGSRRMYSPTNGTIDLDPDHPAIPRASSSHVNPFEDARSFQTTSTSTHGGTNIIPIELVPAGSNSVTQSIHSPTSPRSSSSHIPARPARSPELSLNEGLTQNYYPDGSSRGPASQISGISGHSLGSYASYSSDFVNEAPTIVTGTRGVRQAVLGVGKAELVRTPSVTSSGSGPARPSVRSPLANSSFGPTDALLENVVSPSTSITSDPFSDHKIGTPGLNQYPPTPYTVDTGPARAAEEARNAFSYVVPPTPDAGLNSGISTPGNLRSPYGDVKSDSDTTPRPAPNTFAAQQENALLHAQSDSRNINRGSMATNASGLSQADTILAGFPFVHPTPITATPARPAAPPVPALPVVQSPSTATPTTSTGLLSSSETPLNSALLSPEGQAARINSGFSATSSGLSPFTFDIPPIPETPQTAAGGSSRPPHPLSTSSNKPASAAGDPKAPRKRSSLDTLALLSDLHSYPIGYDKKK